MRKPLKLMIHIYDKYYLGADSLQFIVYEKNIYKTGKNKGQECFINSKYFPKISMLFEYLLDELLKNELMTEESVLVLTDMREKQEQFSKDLIEIEKNLGEIKKKLK